jgi:hypothetical protein
MELALVVLTAPTPAAGTAIGPQVLGDILWANADPAEGLEHVSVRAGPEPGSYTVGMFLLPLGSGHADAGTEADTGSETDIDSEADAANCALRLCRRAIQSAPALSGWALAQHRAVPAS